MLFRRRDPDPWYEKLRLSLWPRRSWMRSSQYFTKRILRITATPHAIAAGIAAGVFVSYTPFLGLHFILAGLVAYLLAGNVGAALLGTWFGNPATFPLIWLSAYTLGQWILTGEFNVDTSNLHFGQALGHLASSIGSLSWTQFTAALDEIWTPLLKPMVVGGVPLGTMFALIAYFLTRRASVFFRESRRKRLMNKARSVREAATGMTQAGEFGHKAGS